jgi:FKBP-type peptidyl-prolyl cis-trans isomerase
MFLFTPPLRKKRRFNGVQTQHLEAVLGENGDANNGGPKGLKKMKMINRREAMNNCLKIIALLITTSENEALAYGLNKKPPNSDDNEPNLVSFLGIRNSSKQERFEASERKKREAEKIRERKEEELESDAPLMTLPSGIQFREYDEGVSGTKRCRKGSKVSILFKVFRLSSGAYFKYSSGGTAVLLWARGYGSEGLDDVGVPYTFILGEENSLPRAVAPVVVGMRQGGVRRVLMPPNLGYVNDFVQPQPDSYGARRRLENYRDGPLLFEVEIVSVKDPGSDDSLDLKNGESGFYKLPSAPTLLDR